MHVVYTDLIRARGVIVFLRGSFWEGVVSELINLGQGFHPKTQLDSDGAQK